MLSVVKWWAPICGIALAAFAQTRLTVTTSSPLPSASVQVYYSVQLNATGGLAPYSWTVNPDIPGAPPGLSLSSTGLFSGTPTQAGTFSFQAIVTDSERTQQSAYATLSITVQSVSITSSSPLPSGTVSVSYSYGLNASGGSPPYSWRVSSGNLPPGLTLSASGQISGTPSTAGTYQFGVSVTDTLKGAASANFSLTILAGTLTITTSPPIPNGAAGVAYSFSFTASGGSPPYNWSVYGGTLPAGLSLANTGALTGTPTATGLYNFTIQVSDSPVQGIAAQVATKAFSLRIAQPLTVTTASPLYATQGSSLNLVMTASGGSGQAIWQVATGSQLPPGLTLDTISGFLQGTPTTAGTYNFTIQATDTAGDIGTKPLVMIVAPPIAISTASPVPDATAGSSYSLTLAATGGNPPYTWKLDSGSLPAGLSLDPAAGTISGTPQTTGAASFVIRVTDTVNATVVKNFSLTVDQAAPGAQLSTSTLNFSALAGGDAPPPQNITLISLGSQALTFTTQTDGGPVPPAPTPTWLTVRLSGGSTPANIIVAVDQTGLQAGQYQARILINTSDGKQYIVTVNLTVTTAAQQLDVSPNYLRFAGSGASLASAEQDLLVRNTGGGGPLAFQVAVAGDNPWLSVNPSSGQAGPNSPGAIHVLVSAQSLPAGARRGVVRITSAAGSADVPVSLLVRNGGPVIGLDLQGDTFNVRAGNGNALVQVLNVLNLGDGTLNWSVAIVSGGDWLSLSSSSGQAPSGGPSQVLLSADPGARDSGAYYALIRVTDSNALNSPQYFTAVLNVAPAESAPAPRPIPQGLVFITREGLNPTAQTVTLYPSSTMPVAFQVSADTFSGGNWLSVTPASGTASTSAPGKLSVSVNAGGLANGVYTGAVSAALSSTAIQSSNVTLIVQPPPPPGGHLAAPHVAVAGCTPSKLALTSTALYGNFNSPAGWPTPLAVALSDDCGSPVTNGQVVTTFSNGDPALVMKLTDPTVATYSGTWSPGKAASAVTVTARASAPNLTSASVDIAGAVTANKVPVLSTNGTLNNLNPVIGAPIAPGTVAEVFGSSLAPSESQPGVIPLPTEFDGTQALIGGLIAPLYYLSDTQLDVQVPTELEPDRDYSVVVAANGGYTLPDTITTAAVSPAIAEFSDGTAIAQHSDFSVISAASPAVQGEPITLYLIGMGATNPPVASAVASPSTPLASAVAQPTVTIGGQKAQVQFAGLTPGAAGLYQINVTVPVGLPSGPLPLVITQSGVTANPAVLPVR